MSPVRKAAAAVLLWIAGMGLTGSASTALNVFADYKDSPDSTYLFFAGVWLAISGGLIAIGMGLLLVGSQPGDRRRQAAGALLVVVGGAGSLAAWTFGYELGEIANDPKDEAGNAAAMAASVVTGIVGAVWGISMLRSEGRWAIPRRRLAIVTVIAAAAGIGIVYLVVPPGDDERLAGAVALVDNRAVGCTEQDGWYYCRTDDRPGTGEKDYVVTFDGDCFVTLTPIYRHDQISRLKEIRDDCLNRRGVGRTRPGPGNAPPALAEAADRFLPNR